MKRVIFSLATLAILVSSATVFAYGPRVCDPEEDASNCECTTESGADLCQEIAYGELITPDDPAELREAANLQSEYDSEQDIWHVSIDVRGFNGGAILPMHSNQGHWDNHEEFFAYAQELYGIDMVDEEGNYAFPKMRVETQGTVVRFNQFDGAFIESYPGTLMAASLADEHGIIHIGADDYTVIPDVPDSMCDGEDPLGETPRSFDERSGSDLAAQQCSLAYVKQLPRYQPDGTPLPGYQVGVVRTFKDHLHLTPDNRPRISCSGNDIQNGDLVCETSFGPIFRWESTFAEESELKSYDFHDQTLKGMTGPDGKANAASHMLRGEDTGDSYTQSAGPNGTCGHGETLDNNDQISTRTRAGQYEPEYEECIYY